MNAGLRPFQVVLFAIFGVMMVGSFLLFLAYKPPASEEEQQFGSRVLIWGTLPARTLQEVIESIRDQNEGFRVVSYEQIDSRTFRDQLVNAIAEGRSPDVVLLPHTELVPLRSKLYPVAFSDSTITQRQYQDTYVDGASIFALSEGVYATPIMVDPLVMYWNRDILASNNFAEPPKTWESIVASYVPTIIQRDFNRNILLSPIALGEYRNIKNGFAIISALALQGGSKMVVAEGTRYQVELDESVTAGVSAPFSSALDFYTGFARINNPLYSWNRAQVQDTNAFAAGDLALYFGMGSEYDAIARLNPNVSYDIADFPQGAGSTARRTYGTFYGYALLNASTNKNGAYAAIRYLSTPSASQQTAKGYSLAPVHRQLLSAGSLDSIDAVRYRSAVIARGWLSPALEQAESLLQTAIEDVLANRARIDNAARDANSRLSNVY